MKLGLIVVAFMGFVVAAIAISRLLEMKQPKTDSPATPPPLEDDDLLAMPDAPPDDNTDGSMPYVPRESLLTEGEQAFLPVLEEAVAIVFGKGDGMFDGHRVNVQVQVSRIIGVPNMTDRSAWQSWFNKIDRKSIDFVVCDEQLRPKIAIELNDPHEIVKNADWKERRAFLDEAFAKAGVRLVHIPARAIYRVEGIVNLLRDAK